MSAESTAESSQPELDWEVGDKAVYPSHGVGEITAIESNDLFGPNAIVFVLELLESSRRILIPTHKAKSVGLRPIVDAEEAEAVLQSLSDEAEPTKQMPWTKRQRALLEKLSSGSLNHVAEVLRELYDLKGIDDLSFGQRRLFDTAVSLLAQETSIALEQTPEEIEERIMGVFT